MIIFEDIAGRFKSGGLSQKSATLKSSGFVVLVMQK
jgi:hypothetical protein